MARRMLLQPRQIMSAGDKSMNLGIRSLLLIVAIVCFVLATVGVGLGDLSLIPLGLAFFAAAFLVGDGGLRLRT
jgi:hypothetical protein